MQWDTDGIKRDIKQLKRFYCSFICFLQGCSAKISTWWQRFSCGVKAFLIVISGLLCLVPVVFLNWWWGKFSYSAASAAIFSLATIWGLLWRNFVNSEQLNEQIAQGERVEKQIAKTDEQLRLTAVKNDADLFAKACEMVGKNKTEAEVTGGISLLASLSSQEESKYIKAVIIVFKYVVPLHEGIHTELIIESLNKISLMSKGIYVKTVMETLSITAGLHSGKDIEKIIIILEDFAKRDNGTHSEAVINHLEKLAPLYEAKYAEKVIWALEDIAALYEGTYTEKTIKSLTEIALLYGGRYMQTAIWALNDIAGKHDEKYKNQIERKIENLKRHAREMRDNN